MLAKPCGVTSQRAAPCSRNSSGLAHEFPLTTIGRSVTTRFFGKSGRTPKLVTKLPNLTVPVLLAAGLVAVVAWVWTDRQRTPVSSHPGPEASPPVQDPAALDAAQQLLDRAILTLEGHRSISAKIRQSGSLYGQEPIGSGVYLQQRVGGNLLFRSDLRIQLGEQASSLVHVRDDDGHLWTYEKLPGQDAELTRVDVQRVVEHLAETGQTGRLATMDKWPGLGGLPKLLRSLRNTFDFVVTEEAELAGQLPVWQLYGRWKPQRLADILPEAHQSAVADGRVDVKKLPPQLPDQVVLLLGKEDLFPYRVEYRRGAVPRNLPEGTSGRWFVILEFYEVRINVATAPTRFEFPTSLDYLDVTDRFIDRLDEAPH